MSITLTGQVLRFAIDAGKPSELFPVEDRRTPLMFTGNDVRLEIGLYKNGLWVDSAANITSLQVEIWRKSSGALLIDEITSSITASPTEENWLAGTAQHAVITLAADDTNFDFGGATAEPCNCEITALLSSGETVTVAKADFQICDTLHANGSPSELPEPTYYTAAQVNALLGGLQKNVPSSTAENLAVRGSDGNNYRLSVRVTDGIPTLELETTPV